VITARERVLDGWAAETSRSPRGRLLRSINALRPEIAVPEASEGRSATPPLGLADDCEIGLAPGGEGEAISAEPGGGGRGGWFLAGLAAAGFGLVARPVRRRIPVRRQTTAEGPEGRGRSQA
jgi:hypothetical protein